VNVGIILHRNPSGSTKNDVHINRRIGFPALPSFQKLPFFSQSVVMIMTMFKALFIFHRKIIFV